MDDWAIRFPTLIDDVANIISQLISFKGSWPPILHFSAQEKYTKYSMVMLMADLVDLPPHRRSNLICVLDSPKSGQTPRPRDCHLSNKSLERLGIKVETTDFKEWWKANLIT